MGQTHSATSKDALAFRQMAVATFRGDLEALQSHFQLSTVNFQISRATYLDICVSEQVEIETLTDSLEKEHHLTQLRDEKMDFFDALESGEIVLGDTLLHLAARKALNSIVDFLLQQPGNSCAEISNFKNQRVKDVASTMCLQIIFQDLQDVHALFGTHSVEEPKIHRFLKSLRRLWPLWMFEGNHEASLLVRAIYDIRSSHAAFSNLVKLALGVSQRYRVFLTWQGLQLAIHLLQQNELNGPKALDQFVKWKTKTKLQYLGDFFYDMFEKSNDQCILPEDPLGPPASPQQPQQQQHHEHKPTRQQTRQKTSNINVRPEPSASTPKPSAKPMQQNSQSHLNPLRWVHHPRGQQFLEFIEHAMETWIQIVQETRLLEPAIASTKVNNLVSASAAAAITTGVPLMTPKTPRKPNANTPLIRLRSTDGQNDSERQVALPGPETIAKFDLQIWRHRLHPPGNDLEELCIHINGIEELFQLTDLKA